MLLRTSLSAAKNFFALLIGTFLNERRYLFRALKFCFSKCFSFLSERCLNTRLFFFKKVTVFPELFTCSTSINKRGNNFAFCSIRKSMRSNFSVFFFDKQIIIDLL